MSFLKKALGAITGGNLWTNKKWGIKGLDSSIIDAGDTLGMSFGGSLNDWTGASDSARQQYQYNKALQDDAQNFNAQQAQIERDWQTQMSNTARQRAVSDLQSAGLNPVLATGAEASSGAGATATSPGASTGAGIAVANPISMITELINASNNTARTKADVTNQTNLTNAEVTKTLAEAGYTEEKIKNAIEERNYIIQSIKNARSEKAKTDAETKLKEWESEHALLIQVLPAVAGIAGGIIGGALGNPLGGALGGVLGGSARKIGFRP